MANKQYIEELDYTRAITAFGIFMIHATGGFALFSEFNSNVMHLGIILNQFFRFGTPVFMAMAGLVLFYSYRNLQDFKPVEFIKKKALFLIVPYVIWSVAYFLFKSYMYSLPVTLDGIIALFGQILVGEVHDHLYFIFLIIQFYVLFPLLLVLLSKPMKNSPVIVLAVVFVLQGLVMKYGFNFQFPNPTTNWLLDIVNTFYYKSIFAWFFYFILGGIIAYHYAKVLELANKYAKLIVICFFGIAILFIGEVYANIAANNSRDYYEMFGSLRLKNLIFTPVAMVMLLWLTSKMKALNNTFLIKNFVSNVKSIGTLSLGIYFTHPMVLEFIKIRVVPVMPEYLGHGRVLSLVLFVTLTWMLTIFVCYLISKFNWRWLLMGKTPTVKFKFWLTEKANH